MPKPADLNVGELAVNNNVDNEFISLKNTDEEVVRFSSDKQIVSWMNEKEVFPVSGDVSTDIASNTSQIIIRNNQYADSATTGAYVVNHSGVVIDTSAFALSGGNVTFNSVTVNDISAVTINGKDANSLGDITNITYTPNDEIEDGVSGNTLEFAQSGNNNTISVNLVFDDELNNTSVNAVQNKVLNDVLEEMEEVTAASLNDLNDRVLELENTPDLHVTGGRFSNGTLYIEQENGPTIEIGGISTGEGADGNNYPSSLTLNSNDVLVLGRNGMSNLTVDLSALNNGDVPNSGRVESGTGAQSGSTFINFYNGTTKLFSVNADDLMIDGMVESVSIGQAIPDGETEEAACLIVVWNTAAGNKTTNLPLSSIFNPNNYYTKQDIQNNYYTKQDVYTKQEINNALGDDFHPSSVTSSVTEVINSLEDRVGVLEEKPDKFVSGGSFSNGTLTLKMSDNTAFNIPGISTGEGADGNDYVFSGEVLQNSGVVKLTYTNPVITDESGHVITGLSEYIDSKTSGFVETADDKHVTGGSVNNQGIIVVEQNGVSPNVELSGLPSYVDSRLVGKYLPLSGGTVSGPTIFADSIRVDGSSTFNESVQINEELTADSINANGLIGTTSGFVHSGVTGDATVKNGYVLLAGGGYKALSEISPVVSDVWVNTSGDTMNGSLIFEDLHDVSDPKQLGLIYQGSDYLELHTNGNIVTTNGEVHSAHGFMHDGIESVTTNTERNNYVLLGGGGYKALSEIGGDDTYVDSGTINKLNGRLILNRNDNSAVTISGMSNIYVTTGSVIQDSGVILLSREDGLNSSVMPTPIEINGLAQYVAEHSSVGDWVDVSGDTMTGPLVIDPSGNGVTYALEVDGDVSVSGDVTATGAMYSSDKRLKENIEVVSVEDLENVKNVEFKSFNFISNKDSKRVGVIAQELKDNGLGKFTATNDAGFLTVDYISLLCLKIAELEKEIKELKNNKA